MVFTVLGRRRDGRARAGRAGALAVGGRACTSWRRSASGAASCSTTRCCCTSPSPTNTTSSPASATALGYLGGGLLFAVQRADDAAAAVVRARRCGGRRARVVRHASASGGSCSRCRARSACAKARGHGPAVAWAQAVRPGFASCAHAARDPPLPARCCWFLARLCPLHRRRQHDHQDGGRLRPVAGLRPLRGLIAALLLTQFVALPGGARLRLARAAASARATASSSRSRCMRARRATRISSRIVRDFYPARRRDRAGAGRRAVVEPQLFRPAGAARASRRSSSASTT